MDMPQLTLEMQLCNTRWFLPQNRERIYFVGYTGNRSGRKVFPIGESNQANEESRKGFKNGLWVQSIDSNYYKGADGKRTMIQYGHSQTLNSGHFNQPKIMCDSGQGRKIQNRNNVAPLRANTGAGHNNLIKVKPVLTPVCRTENKINILVQNNIRRLTPLECERLQGFPDNWTEGISDTQRYKCLGNAVTVNVIEAIGRQFLDV